MVHLHAGDLDRSSSLNFAHRNRYDDFGLRFIGGNHKPPVPNYRLGAYYETSLQKKPRAKDSRNIEACHRSRLQQKRDFAVAGMGRVFN
jgi:hypothetical protein